MARRVSAAVLAVEEFNEKLDRFRPMLSKMVQNLNRQTVATEKMLSLQIEQTESARRREEHERVQPKVKDKDGNEKTVKTEKKKKDKNGGAFNIIGGLGGLLSKVALGGIVASFAALQMFDPIKKFVKDVITSFTGELWNNIKENLPKWLKPIIDSLPDRVKERGGEIAATSGTNAAVGFVGGRLLKAITKIPKLGRFGAAAGAGAGALQEFGMNPATAWATMGSAVAGVAMRKRILSLMPEAIKDTFGKAWGVAKGGVGGVVKGVGGAAASVVSGGAKAVAPAASATAGRAASGATSWLGKRLPAVGSTAAKAGRTLAPLMGWGPQAFITSMLSVDPRDGVGQTLSDDQFRKMQESDSLDVDTTKMWIDAQKNMGNTPNLYKFYRDQVGYEVDKGFIEPLSEKEMYDRAMQLAQEALKKYPDAVVKPPANVPSLEPKKPDEAMRLTIPPTDGEDESSPRVYEESKTQTRRERKLSESTEKRNSKPSIVSMRGGNSNVKQGDRVNHTVNNYYSSVDPSKNLDPYRMGWS